MVDKKEFTETLERNTFGELRAHCSLTDECGLVELVITSQIDPDDDQLLKTSGISFCEKDCPYTEEERKVVEDLAILQTLADLGLEEEVD